jgi:hypothetical protein
LDTNPWSAIFVVLMSAHVAHSNVTYRRKLVCEAEAAAMADLAAAPDGGGD